MAEELPSVGQGGRQARAAEIQQVEGYVPLGHLDDWRSCYVPVSSALHQNHFEESGSTGKLNLSGETEGTHAQWTGKVERWPPVVEASRQDTTPSVGSPLPSGSPGSCVPLYWLRDFISRPPDPLCL